MYIRGFCVQKPQKSVCLTETTGAYKEIQHTNSLSSEIRKENFRLDAQQRAISDVLRLSILPGETRKKEGGKGAMNVPFVRCGKTKHTTSTGGQALLHQQTIETQPKGEKEPQQGILVPLDLPGFKMVSQSHQGDGSVEIHVRAAKDQDICPRCQNICSKIHETRRRVKRDSALRSSHVRLVLSTRRFRCPTCRRTFTETENVCGKEKRTTKRCREYLAQQASPRAIAQIAEQEQVGPRFVQDCLVAQGEEHLANVGRSLDETAPFPTPRFLGSDECARRKGHRSETILCDLVSRTV